MKERGVFILSSNEGEGGGDLSIMNIYNTESSLQTASLLYSLLLLFIATFESTSAHNDPLHFTLSQTLTVVIDEVIVHKERKQDAEQDANLIFTRQATDDISVQQSR